MSPELGFNGGPEASSEASASNETGFACEELDVNEIQCQMNRDDHSCVDGKAREVQKIEPLEVDILKVTDSGFKELVESERGYMTESSSSFDSSASWAGNDDAEVISCSNGRDVSSELGDEFRKRKKKVTSHWRTFVQPLSWRIKWVELQVMQLQCLARKYDKELSCFNHSNNFKLENVTTEGLCARSFPFPNNRLRSKILQRKKRRRVEDTEDINGYMSRHKLFSYYEHKKSIEGASIDDVFGPTGKDIGNLGFGPKSELHWLLPRYELNASEQILRRISVLESQVSQLRSRVDKVLSENAWKFSSTENLSFRLPSNALSSSSQNPSPNGGGKKDIVPQGSTPTRADVFETANNSLLGGVHNGDGDILMDNKRMPAPKVEESELPVDNGQPVTQLRSLSKRTSSKIKKKKTTRRRKSIRLRRVSSTT
ncbi:hypothetical protein DM860_012928 [Cuscuta australis]|uniref:Uncharacterized protein n=1 Tax=Cuscuta australis TaxID=267555 RepID=A0A328DUS9_9ASTE|nr:hypothetical protein DM860_012928 [Cuscuta australis]